jgi:hypothetical protein
MFNFSKLDENVMTVVMWWFQRQTREFFVKGINGMSAQYPRNLHPEQSSYKQKLI